MTRRKLYSISVFFPCYNDSKSIKKLVTDTIFILENLTNNFEIIVVDDGSTDRSRQVLKRLSQKHPKLKLIFHEKNKGYGGALRSGFKAASKELIFYTDGDGQYSTKELPLLLNLMTNDVNFINGIKMTRHDATYRIIIGNLYSLIARWVFWLPVYDVDCDFRLIRKELINKLDLRSNSGSICVELVKKAQQNGAKFRQVSVHHLKRRFGHSQFFVPSRLITTFIELFNLWIKLVVISKLFKHKSKKSAPALLRSAKGKRILKPGLNF